MIVLVRLSAFSLYGVCAYLYNAMLCKQYAGAQDVLFFLRKRPLHAFFLHLYANPARMVFFPNYIFTLYNTLS